MKIRDRIKELRRVRAGDLLPDPRNWRTHPQAQQDAMRGVLAEIGYADALLVRETPEGLMLCDGHLRAETTPDQEVPVLILDVDEAEAAKLMLTFDPLAGMAEANDEALAVLLTSVETSNAGLEAMLAELAGKYQGRELGLMSPDQIREAEIETDNESKPIDKQQPDIQAEMERLPPPKCPIVPRYAEHYEAFVIVCDNTIDEAWLRNHLKLETRQLSYKDSKIGQTNIITVDQLRQIIE